MADLGSTPTFATGDPAWNQALGTLAGGLFPNPSAGAQAYYYGSEARKAQIEGYKNIGEINAGNRAFGMLPGSGVPQSPITFQQPPITGMGPIMAPAQNLPIQGQTQQPPPNLSQTVAPPGGQGGPPVSAPPPQGAIPPPVQVDTGKLAQLVAPGSSPNEKGVGTTGTPPPASPPSVSMAPPAPNTTTTNGQVPTNDQGSGPVHIGAVTDTDGGRKYAGPAQPNGAPAPPAFDLGTYAALQAAAGRNPEMAKVQILSYILDAEQRGNLPVGTAKGIEDAGDKLSAAFGSPVFGVKQETLRTQITDAGATKRTGMAEAGATQRVAMTPQTAVGPNGPVFTTTGQINAAPGTIPSYQPNYDVNLLERQKFEQTPLQTQARGPDGRPITVMPGGAYTGMPAYSSTGYSTDQGIVTGGTGGPFSKPILLKNQDVQPGQPGYTPQVDVGNSTPVEVYHTKPDGTPDVTQPGYKVTTADAIQQKLPLTPNNSDQVSAFVRQGALSGDVSAPAKRLGDVVAGTAPITPPSSASQEGGRALTLQDDYIKNTYTAPDLTGIAGARKEPAQLVEGASAALTDRRDELMRANPRLTPENALQTARSQLENEGYIPSTQQSAEARKNGLRLWGNENINNQVKNGQVQGKFMIPLLKDYKSNLTGTTIKAGPSGAGAGTGVGKDLGAAEKGMNEGATYKNTDGTTAKVINGRLVQQ